jgi:hypothetical protein
MAKTHPGPLAIASAISVRSRILSTRLNARASAGDGGVGIMMSSAGEPLDDVVDPSERADLRRLSRHGVSTVLARATARRQSRAQVPVGT